MFPFFFALPSENKPRNIFINFSELRIIFEPERARERGREGDASYALPIRLESIREDDNSHARWGTEVCTTF
jgi:hypothetical protein